MNKLIKNQSGITLLALTITIIVLLIITAVGIGASAGIKGNIKKSKDNVAMSELSEVQQAVLEIYIKYNQTKNSENLKGIKISYSEAQQCLKELDSSLTLKASSYELSNVEDGKCYYKLEEMHLNQMGIKNSEDTYIVNYSTGEVFNYTGKITGEGNILYTYVNE